jgi:flagellar FliL protein
MADEQDLKLEGTEEKKGKGKLIVIIVVALVLVAGAVGVTLFLISGDAGGGSEKADEAAPAASVSAPAQYVKLKPEFVVSFQVGPRQRFLQLYIEVMSRDDLVVAGLEEHSPRIRSDVIRVISEQDFESLRTAEGRKALQEAIAMVIKQVLREEVGSDAVEQVLFTNYVMQ